MGNVHMEATQINYRGGGVKKSVEEAIKEAVELTPEQKANINKIPAIEAAVATKAAQSIVAPAFDAEAGTYSTGDLVIYDGKLYQFTSDHSTAGAWDPSEAAEVTVSEELASLMSGLINVKEITPTVSTFPTSDKTKLLTFSGRAHMRRANLLLICGGQNGVGNIIPICFFGNETTAVGDILGVGVATNNLDVTATDLTVRIPSLLGNWGSHTLINLYPEDDFTWTVTSETN